MKEMLHNQPTDIKGMKMTSMLSQVCTLPYVNDAIAICNQHIWLQGKHASLADGVPETDLAALVSNDMVLMLAAAVMLVIVAAPQNEVNAGWSRRQVKPGY